MDRSRFDALSRALGARATRRAGLIGLLAALVVDGAAARRPGRERHGAAETADDGAPGKAGGRNECGDSRPCPAGWECRKARRRRRCVCQSGVTCGEACCAAGDVCRNGACAAPEPTQCLARGEACVGTGRACCAGLACGSGQGGMKDVACYGAAGSVCAETADCTYGTSCRGGTCTVDCACTVCAGWDTAANGLALQAAIDAAEPGSTVFVQPGTYASPMADLPFPDADEDPHALFMVGKSVTLAPCGDGTVSLGPTWVFGDVDVTLTGLSLAGSDKDAALTVLDVGSGRPRASIGGCVLSGSFFGLMSLGANVTVHDGSSVSENAGAGIIAIDSDLRVQGPVTVARNGSSGIMVGGGTLRATGDVRVVDNVGFKQPGGILVSHACWTLRDGECVVKMATAYLEGITVSGNVSKTLHAGGIQVDGELVAVGITVRGNWSGREYDRGAMGGGVVVERFDCEGDPDCDPGGRATLVDSLVADNRSGPDPLGSGDANAGSGGGIGVSAGASLTLVRTTVRGNAALQARGQGAGPARGGGIALTWAGQEPMPLLSVDNGSPITGNLAQGPGAEGGGIYASDVTPYVVETVSGNAPDPCICVTCPQ